MLYTILTQTMADEFNLSLVEIQNYIAGGDADLIPVPGQLELHGVADLIAGMEEELELLDRRRGRSNFRKT